MGCYERTCFACGGPTTNSGSYVQNLNEFIEKFIECKIDNEDESEYEKRYDNFNKNIEFDLSFNPQYSLPDLRTKLTNDEYQWVLNHLVDISKEHSWLSDCILIMKDQNNPIEVKTCDSGCGTYKDINENTLIVIDE